MYSAFLLCLMMTVTCSWAEGSGGCLKKIVTPTSGPACVDDTVCELGYHYDHSYCSLSCVSGFSSTSQFYYCGVDVTCTTDITFTPPDLESCVQLCEADTDCVSGSYNNETTACLVHYCGYLGNTYSGVIDPGYTQNNAAGPNTVYFVRDCF